jgi:hypothetical protein
MNDKAKPCCPHCRSEKLLLIGGVFLAKEGVTYAQDRLSTDMLSSLIDHGGKVTRELLSCLTCGKQSLLMAAQEAADIAAEKYIWETTSLGTTIPIVCPDCGNHKDFVRKMVWAVETTQLASTDNEEERPATVFNMSEPLDKITVAYLCDADDCDGEVTLRDKEYQLTETPQ